MHPLDQVTCVQCGEGLRGWEVAGLVNERVFSGWVRVLRREQEEDMRRRRRQEGREDEEENDDDDGDEGFWREGEMTWASF